MNKNFLNRLLVELNDLNNTPKFQFERAISPLLTIFIKDIINKKFEARVTVTIPEFPLKKGLNNQSTNIDWLLIDETNFTLYCVELKTDNYSISNKQIERYFAIKDIVSNKGASFLFEQINKIAPHSVRKEKYKRLLEKIDSQTIDFSVFKNFKIIYLVPDNSILNDERVIRINLSELPMDISTEYKEEWRKINDFLISLYAPYKKQENIYLRDPEEDQNENEKLIEFLESIGYKMPEVIIVKKKEI